ncbi:MAG: ABC transporter permease subunit [Lachnospiraceae bacterium]|nr:ABC transporter permease subunit [Lachnospiraceae bacterium]
MKKAIPVLFWLLVWQLIAMIVHNKILLAGPVETLSALIGLAFTVDFWISVGNSLLRILLGFVCGVAGGVLCGYAAGRSSIAKAFLTPLFQTFRSVPVASFVILLLIWFGNRNISVLITMIVTMPILYHSTLEGMEATDEKLLEMCKVYRVGEKNRIRYVYLPQLYPFLTAALKLSVGMSFKSGVAAEVIGQPLHTMGNGLYLAKIYLETAELFAWTLTIVVLAAVCEKLLMLVLLRGTKE